MRVRVSQKNLRVEIENETRVLPESLSFENEMRVSQKSDGYCAIKCFFVSSLKFFLKNVFFYLFLSLLELEARLLQISR